MARKPKGTPTSLNVFALGRVANGRREFPSRVASTSAPHVRRCISAGLVEVAGGVLRLTETGIAAINAHPLTTKVSA